MKNTAHLDKYIMSTLTRRLAAMLYDTFLLLAIWFLIGFIAVGINHGDATHAYNPLLMSALYLSTFIFYTYFWTTKGQTLGMRAWKLSIISQNGLRLTLIQCLLRFFVSHFSFLLFGLGYWSALFNKYKLSWHDQYSETAIIRTE